jgi:5-formyltetrahydrofolate cyclo-ligase
MDATTLKAWRKAERARLIAARVALAPSVLDSWRRRMDVTLERSFPGLARCRLAFCWPIKGEYDARHLARTLRFRGALTALPAVVAPKSPLVFREWHPGIVLAKGPLDIPYPADSQQLTPDAVLLPMNGWDPQGYRLGYGAGFFDRTLAAVRLRRAIIAIGLAYDEQEVDAVPHLDYDQRLDWVLTPSGPLKCIGS